MQIINLFDFSIYKFKYKPKKRKLHIKPQNFDLILSFNKIYSMYRYTNIIKSYIFFQFIA